MKLYNTANGIHTYLTDLASLNSLFEERRAGYDRHERLDEFCVLGRFYLDTCGNCNPITENAPADLYPGIPHVMTSEQLIIFMRGEPFTCSYKMAIPPTFARCSVCDKPWTIANCHDIVVESSNDQAPLEEFVGQPFADIRQIPALADKKRHYIHRDAIINGTREGKPDGTMTDGRPWFYVKADYIVQPGDTATIQVFVHTHEACYRKTLAATQRTHMEKTFAKAGFPKVNLITIPNEYHGRRKSVPYHAAPWYNVQVGDGPVFQIGWRKRVISIEWKDTGIRLPDLFKDEDVTQDDFFVHAWGYDKAAEYLAKLIPALNEGRS